MAIVTSCRTCQAKLSLGEEHAGKKVRCPKCREIFVFSGVEAPTPLAPPAASAPFAPAPLAPPILPTVPPARSPDAGWDDDLGNDAPPPPPKEAAAGPTKPSPAIQAVGIGAAIIGAVLGRWVGLPMLIVAVLGAAVAVPLYFLTSGRRRIMVGAGGVQAGHALWMLLGAILLAAGVIQGLSPSPLIFVEAGLFLAGAILVVLLPSLAVIIPLTVYQVVACVFNVITLTQRPPEDMAKALVLHIVLRVFAVVLMFKAYFRKEPTNPGLHVPPDEGMEKDER